jgi:nucleotide-binding universal stress UspA family protein
MPKSPTITVKLTASEREARIAELASKVREHDALKEEAKEVAKDFKERIEAAGKRVRELTSAIETWTETREIDAQPSFPFSRGSNDDGGH